jgi:hypothetical protein
MAAIYKRLSRDDGGDAESNSIVTQSHMLRRYAKENGLAIYDEYAEACGIIEPTQRSPKTLGLRRVGSNYTIGAAQPQL